jgi:hypothetical protein
MQLEDGTEIVFLIPKFHLPSHGRSCQTKYSFNFVRFVGRTHGETVEQEWSHINGAVLMTREMGSGARHAALDDHWGGWNWMKLIGLGRLSPHFLNQRLIFFFTGDYLATSFNKAAIMKEKHRALADRYSETFPPEQIAQWMEVMRAWHEDNTNPDPFAEVEEGESQVISQVVSKSTFQRLRKFKSAGYWQTRKQKRSNKGITFPTKSRQLVS